MIKLIHESDMFGFIIEAGCAATLANSLMGVEGSSKTVAYAIQPYSKDYQNHKYDGEKFARSVSKEYTQSVLDKELTECFTYDDKINFGLVTSWQMPTTGAIHGWYSVYYKGLNIDIHVSMSALQYANRSHILSTISDIGQRIMFYLTKGKIEKLFEDFREGTIMIDMFDSNTECPANRQLIAIQKHAAGDYPLVFENGHTIRFEDLMRKGEKFLIQKGSFNPLHHAHKAIMDEGLRRYPDAVPVFLISTYRYDKPYIEYEDLMERVKFINDHGYIVIVMKSVYFYDTFDILDSISDNKKMFYFSVGTDTMNRIFETDIKDVDDELIKIDYVVDFHRQKTAEYADKFKLVLFDREGYTLAHRIPYMYEHILEYTEGFKGGNVSSTAIRQGIIKNLLDDKTLS